MFKDKVLKVFNDKGGFFYLSTQGGYFRCKCRDYRRNNHGGLSGIGRSPSFLGGLSSKILMKVKQDVGFTCLPGQIEFYNERTFANVRIGETRKFVTIEGIRV